MCTDMIREKKRGHDSGALKNLCAFTFVFTAPRVDANGEFMVRLSTARTHVRMFSSKASLPTVSLVNGQHSQILIIMLIIITAVCPTHNFD